MDVGQDSFWEGKKREMVGKFKWKRRVKMILQTFCEFQPRCTVNSYLEFVSKI